MEKRKLRLFSEQPKIHTAIPLFLIPAAWTCQHGFLQEEKTHYFRRVTSYTDFSILFVGRASESNCTSLFCLHRRGKYRGRLSERHLPGGEYLIPGFQGVSNGLLVPGYDLPKSYPVNSFQSKFSPSHLEILENKTAQIKAGL